MTTAVIAVESVDQDSHRISKALKTVIVGAFAVLGSLKLREIVKESIELLSPGTMKRKILLNSFLTALIFLIVIVLTVAWQ